MPLEAGAGAAAASSVTDGFSAGCEAACLVSVLAVFLGIDAGGGSGLWSPIFGLVGAGGGAGVAVAVVSALPKPTLRARLLKKPSDSALGAAEATATRATEFGATVGAGVAVTNVGLSGACGGLTWPTGMVPGSLFNASDRPPPPSPPSDNPVLPSGR